VGEGHTGPYSNQDPTERLTVAEAADVLGISAEAVRMRIRRGTLRSERHEGGVYVLVDTDQTRHVADVSTDRTDLLITTLREQLAAERRANEENRRIIAALTQRIPELPAAPAQEPSQEPPAEEPHEAEPRPATEGRSWWRRMFG
jgi:excisionase family DNA binding protein